MYYIGSVKDKYRTLRENLMSMTMESDMFFGFSKSEYRTLRENLD
jgi:hypothetical protein